MADEIGRNRDFLWQTFGVRDSPFFRPPFGARDERTDRIAADQGHPTVAMWNGTLGDSRVLTGRELMAAAQEWFTAQAIIVGHANHPTVTTLYGDLVALIRDRRAAHGHARRRLGHADQRLRGATAGGPWPRLRSRPVRAAARRSPEGCASSRRPTTGGWTSGTGSGGAVGARSR